MFNVNVGFNSIFMNTNQSFYGYQYGIDLNTT